MAQAPSPTIEISMMKQLLACRAAIEPELYKAIEAATEQGWKPAEVAMAIADAADDFIFALARRPAAARRRSGRVKSPEHKEGHEASAQA